MQTLRLERQFKIEATCLGALLLLTGTSCARSSNATSSKNTTASRVLATSSPPPMSVDPVYLDEPVQSKAGFTLSPPPDGATPGITAESALQKTWDEDGTEGQGEPTAVHLTFAYLSWGDDYKDAPVWLVTYEGTCVPVDLGVGSSESSLPQTCRPVDVRTLVDSNSGAYIATFADASLST